jgi:hypothetical protein
MLVEPSMFERRAQKSAESRVALDKGVDDGEIWRR